MDELTKEFVAESQEGLERMELCLTELEHRPADEELLSEIFRTVHTIKGTTSFLRFARLETLAHSGESLLGALRDGKLTVTPELITGLLCLMDGLRTIVSLIDTTGNEYELPADNDAALIDQLNRLRSGGRESSLPSQLIAQGEEHTHPGLPSSLPNTASTQNRTLRIDVDTLDSMMNLVGELVLTRNQILQRSPNTEGFSDLARRLDTVTSALRESVRQARMQPLGHLFAKFPRMVRDLAQTCERRVRIEFEGQETGLDKTLLEAIRDPLTHAVRNSVDHGIEPPDQRILAGKPPEGLIRLRAFQQGGSVVIEVIDDGSGIPAAAVLKKSMDRGLVSVDQAATMSEHEMLQLIFAPGLSLSPEITHISGRGVGMDVVKTNVQKVGGSVEVESVLGVGTTLRLRVPLTLAIVPALVVRSGGQSFALPQHSLIELVNLQARNSDTVIERLGTTEVFHLRDSLLPVIRLDNLLELQPGADAGKTGSYIAVMEECGRRFGLVIDDLNPPEEIVVKPLSGLLRNLGIYSGATVLGNGDIALILDVKAIADRAGHKSVVEAPAPSRSDRPDPDSTTAPNDSESMMVVYELSSSDAGEHVQMAIPLAQVERIETIPLSAIQSTNGRGMLQYRGELILLENQGELLFERTAINRTATSSASRTSNTALLSEAPATRHDNSSATVTIMICQRTQLSAPKRFGIVLHRVLNISSGILLTESAELGSSPLAIFQNRIATVHDAFQGNNAPSATFQEVA